MIILFTNSNSVLNYWKSILDTRYEYISISRYIELLDSIPSSKTMIMMDENSVKDILRVLKQLDKFKQVDILLFNNNPKIQHALPLLSKGIKGYENTYMAKENLLKMIKTVKEGNRWYFHKLTNYIVENYVEKNKDTSFLDLLTKTEMEIVTLISQGLTNKEIAIKQNIALSTVKGHIAHIFEKVCVRDRISLVLML